MEPWDPDRPLHEVEPGDSGRPLHEGPVQRSIETRRVSWFLDVYEPRRAAERS